MSIWATLPRSTSYSVEHDGLEIRVASHRVKWLILLRTIFMVWVVFWLIFTEPIRQLAIRPLTHFAQAPISAAAFWLFCLVWLFRFLFMFFGAERIIFRRDEIVFERSLFGLTRTNRCALANAEQLGFGVWSGMAHYRFGIWVRTGRRSHSLWILRSWLLMRDWAEIYPRLQDFYPQELFQRNHTL